MVRAYLVGTEVVGFGHLAVNALHPTPPGRALACTTGPDEHAFQQLRHSLESSWIEMLCETVGLPSDHVPLLCDCDFMLGQPRGDNPGGYVLCEINVSSVAPYPPSAIAPLVTAVRDHLLRARGDGTTPPTGTT